jgi:sugar lactone lactonase YvrE
MRILLLGGLRRSYIGLVCLLLMFASAGQSAGEPVTHHCQICWFGPDDIVFDHDGNIYVTDSDHRSLFRIVKLSRAGALIASWPVFAQASGPTGGPEGIAIDGDGNIFVVDTGARQILKLSSTGLIRSRIDDGTTRFNPGHVAVAPDESIYVSEPDSNAIERISSEGRILSVWRRPRGRGPEQWDGTESIAMRPDGGLVLEDWRNRRVAVLSRGGRTVFAFGGAGSGPGRFENSSGLCVDRDGNIYVADWKLHRVQKFSPDGKLLAVIADSRSNALFLQGPTSIAIDSRGRLYAADGLTIVIFTLEGKLLDRWQ